MVFGSNKISNAQDEMENLVSELRGILSSKDLDSVPEIRQLRKRLDQGLSEAQNSALESAREAARQTREAARAAVEYAHDEPLRVAGVALAVGVVVGFLLGRR